MSDSALRALAVASGVAPSWRDAFGRMQEVSAASLRAVLHALDVPADTDAAVRDSLARCTSNTAPALPPLITTDAGQPTAIPAASGRWRITFEDGGVLEGAAATGETLVLPAMAQTGYHELLVGAQRTTLAVAPPRCYSVRDAAPAGRLWGIAAQLYALRRRGDGGIGDFAALGAFVTKAAQAGADAVAISPVHAQFSADPDRFSPYSPSSRVHLNVLHGDADDLLPAPDPVSAGLEALPLVDWPAAGRARLARFAQAFEVFSATPDHPLAAPFAAFRRAGGASLELHARFEALHAHLFGRDPHLWHWRSWPAPFHDPGHAAVTAFAEAHASSVTFHAFMQFLADRGLAAAQRVARASGMKIGLISDLAVGTDGGGSHAWARQDETLIGLSVGAPPDILSTTGQDWGLAAFSPTGLVRHGFAAYLEMLRSALRHAGGVRIDHVMGLARLWVLPEAAAASEGAYLSYPVQDLLRLIALESQRARAVVLGEDLGTVPDGFQSQLEQRGLMGLRVLWFERDGDHFRSPRWWTRDAAAMTSTHDLATVAGWWSGRDLEERRPLGMLGDDQGVWFATENRARERGQLWETMTAAGAAHGPAPPATDPLPVVEAAIQTIGIAHCDLALLPTEDALGSSEQPNLPGTTDQHPNWRRRLAFDADGFFAEPNISARLARLNDARQRPEG